MVQEICESLKIKIIALECDKDHAHMFLNALPTLSPANIMAKIKGVTSKQVARRISAPTTLAEFVDTFLFCFDCWKCIKPNDKDVMLNNKKQGGEIMSQTITVKIKLLPTKEQASYLDGNE